jgi:hypothetical protein
VHGHVDVRSHAAAQEAVLARRSDPGQRIRYDELELHCPENRAPVSTTEGLRLPLEMTAALRPRVVAYYVLLGGSPARVFTPNT